MQLVIFRCTSGCALLITKFEWVIMSVTHASAGPDNSHPSLLLTATSSVPAFITSPVTINQYSQYQKVYQWYHVKWSLHNLLNWASVKLEVSTDLCDWLEENILWSSQFDFFIAPRFIQIQPNNIIVLGHKAAFSKGVKINSFCFYWVQSKLWFQCIGNIWPLAPAIKQNSNLLRVSPYLVYDCGSCSLQKNRLFILHVSTSVNGCSLSVRHITPRWDWFLTNRGVGPTNRLVMGWRWQKWHFFMRSQSCARWFGFRQLKHRPEHINIASLWNRIQKNLFPHKIHI